MTVEVEGLSKLVRDLQRLGTEVDDIKDGMNRIATMVSDSAKAKTPVRSGQLQNTIRPNRAKNKAIIRAGSARVPYAGVINYGWPRRNIKAVGFMESAVSENQERVVEALEQEISQLLNKLSN